MLEDVTAVISVQLQDRVYAIADAAGEGNVEKALKLYHDLLLMKETPLAILSFLSKTLLRLLEVRELRDEGLDAAAIADRTGAKLFIVRKNISLGNRFSPEKIQELLRLCSDTDYGIKSGQIKDTLGVELVITAMGN